VNRFPHSKHSTYGAEAAFRCLLLEEFSGVAEHRRVCKTEAKGKRHCSQPGPKQQDNFHYKNQSQQRIQGKWNNSSARIVMQATRLRNKAVSAELSAVQCSLRCQSIFNFGILSSFSTYTHIDEKHHRPSYPNFNSGVK